MFEKDPGNRIESTPMKTAPLHSDPLSPEWAIALINRILKTEDQDQQDALCELLAGVAPDMAQDKYKYDAAWAAITYVNRQSRRCEDCARRNFSKIGSALSLLPILTECLGCSGIA